MLVADTLSGFFEVELYGRHQIKMATNPEEHISFDSVYPPYPQTGLYPPPVYHTVLPHPSRGSPFPPRAGYGYYQRGSYPHPHHDQFQQQYRNSQCNPGRYNRGGRRWHGNYRGKRKRSYYEPRAESSEGDHWFQSVLADPWEDLVTEEEERIHKQRLYERFTDIPADEFISSTSTVAPSSVTDPVLSTTEPHSCKVAATPVQSLPLAAPLSPSPQGKLSSVCSEQEDSSKEPLIQPPCSPDPEIHSQLGGPLTRCDDNEVDSKHFV